MNTKFFTLFISFSLIFTLQSGAQTKIKVEGLRGNSEYVELYKQQLNLTAKLDSLSVVIDDKKKQIIDGLVAENDKKSVTDEVLNLEGKLFQIRGELGVITTKTTAIEQEYIIANMGNSSLSNAQNDDNKDVKSVFEYSKVRNELTKSEIGLLGRIEESNKIIASAIERIKDYKISLDTIFTNFSVTNDKIIGDSLELDYQTVLDEINREDVAATELWNEIFNTKSYIYSRLLDKFLASQDVLNKLSNLGRDVRSEVGEFNHRFLAPNISRAQREQNLLLEYEKSLAELLELPLAANLLEKEINSESRKRYDIDKNELPSQDMVIFAPYERILSKAHSDENPPKLLTVPTNGELHKIQIGIYSKKPTSYVSFYRVSPMEYLVTENGKYYYFAASYKTISEAQTASRSLNRLGMRTSVASWKDGKSENNLLNVDGYKIIITNFTTSARNLIERELPDMEIVSEESEDGDTIFTVGNFKIKSEADDIVEKIGSGAEVVAVFLSTQNDVDSEE